jgi:hypothetical protein
MTPFWDARFAIRQLTAMIPVPNTRVPGAGRSSSRQPGTALRVLPSLPGFRPHRAAANGGNGPMPELLAPHRIRQAAR